MLPNAVVMPKSIKKGEKDNAIKFDSVNPDAIWYNPINDFVDKDLIASKLKFYT